MYVSQLFWIALLFPGFALVRRFYREDMRCGLLGLLGISYLGTFAILSPLSLICYLLHLPAFVFSAGALVTILASLVWITKQQYWRDLGKLALCAVSLELAIVLIDLILGGRVGLQLAGDALLHTARVRHILDYGFTNYNPTVTPGYFFGLYHTNLLHALLAACSQLTGVPHLEVWFASFPFAKILILSGAYYLTYTVFQRRSAAWAAAFFVLGHRMTVPWILYPNQISPIWLMPLILAANIELIRQPDWRRSFRLGAFCLVLGQIHGLYLLFAAMATGPLLAGWAVFRTIRDRRPPLPLVAAGVFVLLTLLLPLASRVSKEDRVALAADAGPAGVKPLMDATDQTSPRADRIARMRLENYRQSRREGFRQRRQERAPYLIPAGEDQFYFKPWAGICSKRYRDIFLLAAAMICALFTPGWRQPQRPVLLLLVMMISAAAWLYIPLLCTLLVNTIGADWVAIRLTFVLRMFWIVLLVGSVACAVEPLRRTWPGRATALVLAVLLGVLMLTGVHWGRLDLPAAEFAWVQRMGTVTLVVLALLAAAGLAYAAKFPNWPAWSAVSLISLFLGFAHAQHKDYLHFDQYVKTAMAPRAARLFPIDQANRLGALVGSHVPAGETILVTPGLGNKVNAACDVHILYPQWGAAGIADLNQRKLDMAAMLDRPIPWSWRVAAMQRYGIRFMLYSGDAPWAEAHANSSWAARIGRTEYKLVEFDLPPSP